MGDRKIQNHRKILFKVIYRWNDKYWSAMMFRSNSDWGYFPNAMKYFCIIVFYTLRVNGRHGFRSNRRDDRSSFLSAFKRKFKWQWANEAELIFPILTITPEFNGQRVLNMRIRKLLLSSHILREVSSILFHLIEPFPTAARLSSK